MVGDIIDGWKLHRGFHWNDSNTLVIRRILGLVKRGTVVRCVAGNHDESLRSYIDELRTALTRRIELVRHRESAHAELWLEAAVT